MAKQVTTPKPDEFAKGIKFSKSELEDLARLSARGMVNKVSEALEIKVIEEYGKKFSQSPNQGFVAQATLTLLGKVNKERNRLETGQSMLKSVTPQKVAPATKKALTAEERKKVDEHKNMIKQSKSDITSVGYGLLLNTDKNMDKITLEFGTKGKWMGGVRGVHMSKEIAYVQQLYNNLVKMKLVDGKEIKVDGFYGKNTMEAVKKMQELFGAKADGYFGKESRTKAAEWIKNNGDKVKGAFKEHVMPKREAAPQKTETGKKAEPQKKKKEVKPEVEKQEKKVEPAEKKEEGAGDL